MNSTEHLKSEIERVSVETGLAPTTIGRMVGQGGHFYNRLCEGKRVWPETADSVLEKLEHIKSPSSDASTGGSQAIDSLPSKDVGSEKPGVKGAA